MRAALSAGRVKTIGRIKLHARAGCQALHKTPARLVIRLRADKKPVVRIDHIVVVIAAIGRFCYTLPDCMECTKIQRRSLHRQDAAGRDERVVRFRVAAGEQPQLLPEHIAGIVAGKVEKRMVCQIADRIRIADSLIMQRQAVVLCQRNCQRHIQTAGIRFLAVSHKGSQAQLVPGLSLHHLPAPQLLVQSAVAAVQMIDAMVVAGKLILLSIQGKASLADTVAAAPDRRSKERHTLPVSFIPVVAEHHIRQPAVTVRHKQRQNQRAKVADVRADGSVIKRVTSRLTGTGHKRGGFCNFCHGLYLPWNLYSQPEDAGQARGVVTDQGKFSQAGCRPARKFNTKREPKTRRDGSWRL